MADARKVPFVDLQAQTAAIRQEIDAAIAGILDRCGFIGGQAVEDFEAQFAAYCHVRHCVGVGNGTDALQAALWACGIGPGDEVITVANTFVATSEAITAVGAKVVFVDCDPQRYTIDPKRVEAAITPRTKAILPVHLYGQPADMQPLLDLATQHNLRVICDAAQAHGACYRGQPIAALGDCTCFSFYPGKNLGAFGDAGAVVTQNEELAQRVRMYANHGRINKYDHEFEGVNSRLDAMQAAVLSVKLKHLEAWNERRRAVAHQYNDSLASYCTTPWTDQASRHVYHLYVIQTEDRERLRAQLQQRGVASGIHYPLALPLLKAYRHLGYTADDFPVASRLQDTILSLPMHGCMSASDVDYVIHTLRDIRVSQPSSVAA